MNLTDIRAEIKKLASARQASNLARFFKTGKGEYGEGDVFVGLTMPQIRVLARKHQALSISGLTKLVCSPVHEERMLALIIMTLRYPREKKVFYDLYSKIRRYINNWDLVDVTCPRIVGDYLLDKPREVLYGWARSKNLWERRMAVIATAAFIARGDFSDTLKIAEILLTDPHDLIHKAVGWMLREVGKRDKRAEEAFLGAHYRRMPRTMLRYAIEKFPPSERARWMKRG